VSSGPAHLRPAAAEDVERLATIWHSGWRDGHLGYVPDELHAYRRPADFLARARDLVGDAVVATGSSGAVVGFVLVRGDEVEQVYVDAQARGSGVADALLEHAEREVAERFERAWLAVVEGNARARRFYERRGWSNGGSFDYEADAGEGTMTVRALRYEKPVR
jgi:ribosomal protein S18 acetylase RimI-like enzyme